ncbi:MAG TPA: hypothetical protein VJ965_03855 [Anaerolineales bacterium]|nr:hypothetical protein [Anaerolineales bacterium]
MPDQTEYYQRVKKIKETHQDALMKKANVVGVGIGLVQRGSHQTSQIALVVMVTHKLPRKALAPEDIIPKEIDGIPVDVQVTGIPRAQN